MSNILNAQDLCLDLSNRVILDHANVSLQEGDKIGLIGLNGTGKSTLLSILAGIREADSGEVILASHVVIRYLPQNPEFPEDTTVLEYAMHQGRKAEGSWDREGEVKSMLTRLSLTNFEEKTSHLSGGQRKRLALAGTLLSGADLLILDEPTNHLDQEMSGALEDVLKSFRGTLIMVTHDRYFLDSVCNRILELDQGKIYSYEGGYSKYLEAKEERLEIARSQDHKRASLLRTELAWVRRGAQARSTKQKARLQRFEELSNIKNTQEQQSLAVGSVASRMGRTTVELEHICKGYGDRQLIKDFSYIFLKNDRIGFVGPNGCGKTTLMKIIAGALEPDSGNITVGSTIKIGYYAQEIGHDEKGSAEYMDPNQKVIDYIRDTAEYVRTDEGLISASKMLERFLFDSRMQYAPLEKLSGGEKRRLNLLRVLMGAPNVLILDEPTNDLDIATMMILEDFLDHFDGIVITVSHDRYFLDRSIRRIFSFEDGTLVQHEGGYTDYHNRKMAQEQANVSVAKSASTGAVGGGGTADGADAAGGEGTFDKNAGRRHENKIKFSFKEQREYDTIEQDIADLEERIEQLDSEILGAATDFVKLNKLSQEKQEAEEALEEKMERWEFLEDKAAQIEEQKNK